MNKPSLRKVKPEQQNDCPSDNNRCQYVTVHIEPHNSISFKVLLNIYENVYSQIQKYIADDIIVIIFGEACKTTQTFHELFYKYGTTEFRAEVYRFTDFNAILKDLRQLSTDLSSKDDENICSQIKKIQSRIQIKESISFPSQMVQEQKTNKQMERQLSEQMSTSSQLSYLGNKQQNVLRYCSYIPSLVNFSKFISELIILKTTCLNCQQEIENNTVQLSCSHHYHIECLEGLINSQLAQRKSNIYCLCNVKLKLSKNLFGPEYQQAIQVHQEQLFINQLSEIKTNLSERAICCKNKFCHYFYIQNGKYKKLSYCPLCLLTIK